MKKLLLIVGVISIIACVLSLLFAALNLYGYYHVLDGDSDLFIRMEQRMVVSFVIGIVLALVSAVCLFIRSKRYRAKGQESKNTGN